MPPIRTIALSLPMAATLLLAGCGEDRSATAPEATPASAQPAVPESAVAGNPLQHLARANSALAQKRLFEPAGDNALEHYLNLLVAAESAAAGDAGVRRQRLTDSVGEQDLAAQARLAIIDLLPYAQAFVGQAIHSGRDDQAERVIALLERAKLDPSALLPLRQALANSRRPQAPIVAPAPTMARTAPVPAATTPAAPAVASAAVALPPPASAAPGPEPAGTRVDAPSSTVDGVAGEAAVPQSGKTEPAPATPATTPAAAASAEPELLGQVAPRYPARAQRQRIEGWVSLAYVVRADGRVDQLRVIDAEPAGVFEREAMGAVARWRYRAPGRDVPMQRRVDFRLGG